MDIVRIPIEWVLFVQTDFDDFFVWLHLSIFEVIFPIEILKMNAGLMNE